MSRVNDLVNLQTGASNPDELLKGLSKEEKELLAFYLMQEIDSMTKKLRNSIAEKKRLNDLVLSLTEQLQTAQQKSGELSRKIANFNSSKK